MTCIAGLVDGGTVWIGGDSAAFDDNTRLTLIANQKVFRNGDFLIGCSGSLRVADIIRYSFIPPKRPRRTDLARFMRTTFIDALRDVTKKAGALKKQNEIEEIDAHLLVGHAGHLFVLEDDFEIYEPIDDFAAVGCGAEIAQGALMLSQATPPRARVLAALAASERYNTGVRRPFYVLSTDPKPARARG